MVRSDPNASPWNLLLFTGIGLTAFAEYRRLFEGGQSLLIETWVCLFAGVPLYFIQLKLGSLTQKSVYGLFDASLPVLRGVAIALLVHTFFTATLYPAYSVHYICAGFATVSNERQLMINCSNAWNTPKCVEYRPGDTHQKINTYYYDMNTAVEEYIENRLYQSSGMDLENLGGFADFPTFPLVLLLTWIFIFLLVAFGPRMFAWMVSVLGLIATVMMIGVLGYGWSVVADIGNRGSRPPFLLNFYELNMPSMIDFQSWVNPVYKMTYTTGIWSGILPTMGKLMGKGRVIRNVIAVIPNLITYATSWLIVVFIFLISTHLPALTIAPYQYAASATLDKPFYYFGLNFVTIYTAVSIFVYSGSNPAASFLYFLVGYIKTIALLALFVLVILDNIFEAFEGWSFTSERKRHISWKIASAVLCTVMMLLGLPNVTRGGWSFLNFFDLSTLTFRGVIWYYCGLGLLAIYARQKTITIRERISIGLWALTACLAWAVFETVSFFRFPVINDLYRYDSIPLASPEKWLSISWLTASFPLVLILLGIVIFVIQTIIQRNRSRVSTSTTLDSLSTDNEHLAENEEIGDRRRNHHIISRC